MSEYKKYFEAYCREHDLELRLSFEMPIGYETAKGTFDVSSRTVFINAEKLNKEPEYSKLFYLFHELRHASQYLERERFNETIKRSIQSVSYTHLMTLLRNFLILTSPRPPRW